MRVPFGAEADLMKPSMRKASVQWTGGARDGSGAVGTPQRLVCHAPCPVLGLRKRQHAFSSER